MVGYWLVNDGWRFMVGDSWLAINGWLMVPIQAETMLDGDDA